MKEKKEREGRKEVDNYSDGNEDGEDNGDEDSEDNGEDIGYENRGKKKRVTIIMVMVTKMGRQWVIKLSGYFTDDMNTLRFELFKMS